VLQQEEASFLNPLQTGDVSQDISAIQHQQPKMLYGKQQVYKEP
jgi:hypothetical protein